MEFQVSYLKLKKIMRITKTDDELVDTILYVREDGRKIPNSL